MSNGDPHLAEAIAALTALGFPRAQLNERSAVTLLALLDIKPRAAWSSAAQPLIGITPIMDWARDHYGFDYAPNTRETVRRQTMHQFCDAGLAIYNPDLPDRPTNSPKAVYQIAPEALVLLRQLGKPAWDSALARYMSQRETLIARYAMDRKQARVPLRVSEGQTITLSPGEHSELIRAIIHDFAERFAPGAHPLYIGDTGDKFAIFEERLLSDLGVAVDRHGKMPDVVLHDVKHDWLLLIEAVTSHGPVDGKRHDDLTRLFAGARPGLVYVTAFPTRAMMARYLGDIAWETEVWVADSPSHLIHFNGDRFLGPR